MSTSEEDIAKKIQAMKALASRRIDKILNSRRAKQHYMQTSLMTYIFEWLRK